VLGEEQPYFEYLPEVLSNYCRCGSIWGHRWRRQGPGWWPGLHALFRKGGLSGWRLSG